MNKKIMVVLLVVLILFTSGCGSNDYLKDKDNKILQYEKTGQSITKNILCKGNDKELLKIYEEHSKELKIPFNKLEKCENFSITSNGWSGLWDSIFVKPISFLIILLGKLTTNMGIGLILVGLLIRIILLPFSYKTHKQQKNMSKVQAEMQKLEYKYRGREDRESMMMKSSEMMALYKKYKVNPLGGCLVAFLQLPIFFAFLSAVNRTPAIFEDSLLGFNLGMTPYVGLSNGNYLYLLLIILIGLSTYFSFKYSMRSAASDNSMGDQMNMMTKIMTIMIIITSFSLSTALSLYWITTYAFIAIQTFIFRRLTNDNKKDKSSKKNHIKEKLAVKEKLKYGTNK